MMKRKRKSKSKTKAIKYIRKFSSYKYFIIDRDIKKYLSKRMRSSIVEEARGAKEMSKIFCCISNDCRGVEIVKCKRHNYMMKRVHDKQYAKASQ